MLDHIADSERLASDWKTRAFPKRLRRAPARNDDGSNNRRSLMDNHSAGLFCSQCPRSVSEILESIRHNSSVDSQQKPSLEDSPPPSSSAPGSRHRKRSFPINQESQGSCDFGNRQDHFVSLTNRNPILLEYFSDVWKMSLLIKYFLTTYRNPIYPYSIHPRKVQSRKVKTEGLNGRSCSRLSADKVETVACMFIAALAITVGHIGGRLPALNGENEITIL